MVKGYNLDNLEAKFRLYLLAGNSLLDSVTLKNYLSDIRMFIEWLKYSKNAHTEQNIDIIEYLRANFDEESVNSFKRYLVSNKTPVSSINRRLSSIRHLYAFCRKENIISQNSDLKVTNVSIINERNINKANSGKALLHQSIDEQKKISSKDSALLLNSFSDRPKAIPQIVTYKVIERVREGVSSRWMHALYLGLFCIIFALVVKYGILNSNDGNSILKDAQAIETGKTLAFQGKLTDPLGNTINYSTDVRFRLYTSEEAGTAVYDTGSCEVLPNKEGSFKVVIGSNGCGAKISNALFEKHPSLYLGIKVGKDKEITARQRIPNTSLAQNTNYLQGFPIGSSNSSIPYISSDGIIKLAQTSPKIESTSLEGAFKIQSASDISLESGKSSDVHIITGENGSVHFRNQNSNVDNLLISNDGNVSIGGSTPGLFKLEVGGSLGPSLDSIYDLGSSAKSWNNLYVNKICFNTVLDCIEGGVVQSWTASNGTISPLDNKSDLLLGGTATSSAQVKLSSTAGNSSFIRSGYFGIGTTAPISALHVEGALTLTGNVTDITTSNNENLTLTAHGTGLVVINDSVKLGSDTAGVYIDGNGVVSDVDGDLVFGDNVFLGSVAEGIKVNVNGEILDADGEVTINDGLAVNGNFTSGATTTSGSSIMDIGGTGTANALCHSTASGTDDEEIVDCTSTPTADFAEMYPVDPATDYGDVVSLSNITVTTFNGDSIRKLSKNTDPYSNKIIGVVSNNYGDFISVGHNIDKKDNPMPIALKGRVPVKIDPSSQAIQAGDFLTGSQVAGRAIKADRAGMMIGQALEDWKPNTGKETVMVFVQTSYADPVTLADRFASLASATLGRVSGGLFVEKEIISPLVRTDRLEAKSISSEYIYSPVVETQTLTTQTIRATKDKDISIALDDKSSTASRSGDLAKLIIKGLKDRPVATVDAQGNISAEGAITAREASISGTLAAKEVIADNITNLKDRLEQTVKKTEGIDRLDSNINSIQSALAQIQNQPLAQISDPIENLPDTLADPAETEGFYSNLVVSGNTSLFQLSVYNGITSLSDELKLSAASTINLLDGAAVLTKDGNLTLNGTLIAKSGVKTNDLRPLNDSSDITAHLMASQGQNTSFNVKNQAGKTVAQIDASGSAQFNSLAFQDTNIASASAIIAAADNYLENGQYTPAVNSRRAAAGSAMLPQQEEEIIIYNESINDSSLIYLTPTSKTLSSPISIVEKETCTSGVQQGSKPCKPYFKVGIQSKNGEQVTFNWLIIN